MEHGEAAAANAVPNEVYDPVSDTFVEGRIVIDAEGAKSFREQAGMEEPSVTAGELMEAKERHGKRFSIGADERISAALEGVNEERISAALDSLLSNGRIDVRGTDGEKLAAKLAAQEFFKKYAKMKIQLSTGAVLLFAPDEATLERNGGDKSAAWAEYALHQVTSNQTDKEGKNYRAYNKSKVEVVNPMLEKIVLEDKAEINKNGNVIFYSQLNDAAYAKVIAKPLEDGNYRADLSDVTSVYEKGKAPGKLNPLAEVVDKNGLGGVFTSKSTPHIIPYFGVGSQGGATRFSIGDWEGVNKRVAARLEKERQAIEAEGGKLLLAWHGTSSYGFTEFRDTFDFGFFFAKSRATAKGYVRETKKYGGGIYHVALRMKKPYIVDCKGSKWTQIQDPNYAVAIYKDANGAILHERTLYPDQPWNLQEGETVVHPTEKTRDVVARARAWGYDGVIFQNIRDAGSNHASQEADDVYVVFNAKQIKSVAGVTRDDDGKIIPLSRRFNWNNYSDIRYSLSGIGKLDDAESVKRFKAYMEKLPAAVMPKRLASGTPQAALEWFEKNMVGRTFRFYIPKYGYREFTATPGHIGKLVCEGGKRADGTKIVKGRIAKANGDAAKGLEMVRRGEVSAAEVEGWNEKRAKALPLVPEVLTDFDAALHEKDERGNDIVVFLKMFTNERGRPNAVVMKLVNDTLIGPLSAHVRDLTTKWLKNKDLLLTSEGEVYDKATNNSASRRPLSRDNAEGNSPESAHIIPQNGVESQGGNSRFSIGPAEDAAYLDAVARGDMETAQRMVNEAAKLAWGNRWEAATYGSPFVENGEPKVFYHNTNADFTKFDPKKNGTNNDAGWLGDGFYFYGDPNEGWGYGKRKMAVYLTIRNPYFITSEEVNELAEADDRAKSIEFRQQLENEGYDGVYYNGDLRQEAVAFYPSQIKSAYAVTYDDAGNVIPLSKRFNQRNADMRYSIGEPRGVQKQAGVNYPDAADEIAQVEQDVRFSIGSKKAAEYRAIIAKKRPDLDAAEIDATMGEIAKFETPKAQKAALNWYIRGRLRLPEDAPKVTQALEYAERAKADPMQFAGPVELMEALHEFKPKAKPIDPDTVPYLSDKRDMGYGVTTYLVDESRESQQAMREIINTHWGEDANPWCLLHGDGHGNLSDGTNGTYDARHYWEHYSALPKRVAFKNGKLLAFMATAGNGEEYVAGDTFTEYLDYALNGTEYEDEYRAWVNELEEQGEGSYASFEEWMQENYPEVIQDMHEEARREREENAEEEWWDRKDAAHRGIPFGNMKVPGDPFGRWGHYELIDGEIVRVGEYEKGIRWKEGYRAWARNGILVESIEKGITRRYHNDTFAPGVLQSYNNLLDGLEFQTTVSDGTVYVSTIITTSWTYTFSKDGELTNSDTFHINGITFDEKSGEYTYNSGGGFFSEVKLDRDGKLISIAPSEGLSANERKTRERTIAATGEEYTRRLLLDHAQSARHRFIASQHFIEYKAKAEKILAEEEANNPNYKSGAAVPPGTRFSIFMGERGAANLAAVRDVKLYNTKGANVSGSANKSEGVRTFTDHIISYFLGKSQGGTTRFSLSSAWDEVLPSADILTSMGRLDTHGYRGQMNRFRGASLNAITAVEEGRLPMATVYAMFDARGAHKDFLRRLFSDETGLIEWHHLGRKANETLWQNRDDYNYPITDVTIFAALNYKQGASEEAIQSVLKTDLEVAEKLNSISKRLKDELTHEGKVTRKERVHDEETQKELTAINREMREKYQRVSKEEWNKLRERRTEIQSRLWVTQDVERVETIVPTRSELRDALKQDKEAQVLIEQAKKDILKAFGRTKPTDRTLNREAGEKSLTDLVTNPHGSRTRFSLGAGMDAALDKFARGEDAVIHTSIGDVDYTFGRPGEIVKSGRITHGEGLMHIVYARMAKDGESLEKATETAIRVGDAIESGKVVRVNKNKTAFQKDGYEGIVAKNFDGRLVITGYKVEADVVGGDKLVPPELRTTPPPRKEDVVAALPHIISQIRGKSQGGTTRFSIGPFQWNLSHEEYEKADKRLEDEYKKYLKKHKKTEADLDFYDWRDKAYSRCGLRGRWIGRCKASWRQISSPSLCLRASIAVKRSNTVPTV